MNLERRTKAILELACFTGVDVSAELIKNTAKHFPQAGIPRIHNFFEGIYKPAGDRYAFCILSQSALSGGREVYPDKLQIRDDGSWTILYSAKKGSLEAKSNKSLFASMNDKVPLLVIAKLATDRLAKARYRLLGPALIESFDPATRRFEMRGASVHVADQVKQYSDLESAAFMDIRSRLVLPFQIGQLRMPYTTDKEVRDRVFRKIILEEYREQCAVCQSKFLLKESEKAVLIEADSAHIISVSATGPDDPRNGLSLCRRHHWAFDAGLFTVTDAQTVRVSQSVMRAERRRFDLEEYEGEALVPPVHEICRPHEEALHWHQKKVFRRA